MELPIYKIEQSGKGFAISRPDGSKVNETEFTSLIFAEAYLDRLVSMNYCIKG